MTEPLCMKHKQPLVITIDEITGLPMNKCRACLKEDEEDFIEFCRVHGVDFRDMFRKT